jgi:hypothetical protein
MRSYSDLSPKEFQELLLALLLKKHGDNYRPFDSDGMDCMAGKTGFQVYRHCGGQFKTVQGKIRDAVKKARRSEEKPEGLTFVSTFRIASHKQTKWWEKYRSEQAPFKLDYWSTEQLDALAAESAELSQIRNMFLSESEHETRIRAMAARPSWKTCCADLAEFIEDHVETKHRVYRLNPASGKRERLLRDEHHVGPGLEETDEVDGYRIDHYHDLPRLRTLARTLRESMRMIGLRSDAAYLAARELGRLAEKAWRLNESQRITALELGTGWSPRTWLDGIRPPSEYVALFAAAADPDEHDRPCGAALPSPQARPS